MKARHEINKRIVKEIDNLATQEEIKEFLKEILSFELDIIDKEHPRFSETYDEIFNRVF
ncbi:MAG: hypothetical protein HY715_09320 [Planctomycetes bacterium]|uniref:hypothetical protein n=1 Tax=Candidatus Tripitaka californicus TaxID=3367616 RepID=UPI00402A0842|nr:hypothetical protein [Planctomycetota bacterium]